MTRREHPQPAPPHEGSPPVTPPERARDIVGRRLLGAAYREDLGALRTSGRPLPPGATRHGFDRVEYRGPVTATPTELLAALGPTPMPPPHAAGASATAGADTVAQLIVELDNAVDNLAIAYERRVDIDARWRKRAAERGVADAYGTLIGDPPDDQAVAFERLATDGHNLHPCGRTRLGWNRADVLAYDQESDGFEIGFVAVRHDVHLGDDVGFSLRPGFARLPPSIDGYALQPVHPWQLINVLHPRYADLFATGVLREVPGAAIRAVPTTALRTVLLEPDAHGERRYLKLSLDIQVTSTRRSISIASTRNGPVISRLLATLVTDDRVILMPETAGAAMCSGRDVAAIMRGRIDPGRLAPGDVPLPGASLPAISPVTGRTLLAEAVDRFAAATGGSPLQFVHGYANLLLPPLLRLLDAGVGLEAHLQNSIPIFRDGVPVRIAFRDFAGLRLHLPRVTERCGPLPLWDGSVIGTPDIDVVRAKLGYTALQAHLGEIIVRLTESHALDEGAAWRAVRAIIESVYADEGLDPGDLAFFLAPTMPHKALVRMRLAAAGGDVYVPVRNPLHDV